MGSEMRHWQGHLDLISSADKMDCCSRVCYVFAASQQANDSVNSRLLPFTFLQVTAHARPRWKRSSSILGTISQSPPPPSYFLFFPSPAENIVGTITLLCHGNWEDNCMSLWHRCFISFMLHFWFPPESCSFAPFPPLHIFISGTKFKSLFMHILNRSLSPLSFQTGKCALLFSLRYK